MPDQAGNSVNLTDDLISSVTSRQRMDFIDDNVSKIAKQTHNVVRAIHQHGFQRLGGDLKNALGLIQNLFLV